MKCVLKHKKSGEEIECSKVIKGNSVWVNQVFLTPKKYKALGFELVEPRKPIEIECVVQIHAGADGMRHMVAVDNVMLGLASGKRFKAKLVEIVEDEG